MHTGEIYRERERGEKGGRDRERERERRGVHKQCGLR